MDNKLIEQKAKNIREQLGGRIFGVPIEEENAHSKYAVAVYLGDDKYNIYPKPLSIEETAAGILATLEGFKEGGLDHDYDRNVRLVSYQAQIEAPNITMRRLKKLNTSAPLLESGVDVMPKEDDPEDYLFSPRGLLKFSYLEMAENKNPKAISFMKEYYKLLAMRKYGKTAAAIHQEVRRMGKEEGVRWIEKTFNRYIPDGREIFNIMQLLSN